MNTKQCVRGNMEYFKALMDRPECCCGYIDELRMALASACKERDEARKELHEAKSELLKYREAEQDERLLELPFVAMVEQSLRDGKMKPLGDQKHNGRYAVVYVDRNKWKSPLIDICGKPYDREEAEARMAVLAQKGDSEQ